MSSRTDGVAAVGSGSSNIMNPMAVNGVPSGPRVGNWPILELIDCGGNLTWHYRCEDQLGTLRGMTDAAGIRVAEFDTSKYGEVYHKHILFDGRASRIDSASWEPLSQVTHILLVPGVFFPEDVLGAVLRATNSESAATAVVTDVDPNGAYIEFDDPNGAVADVINSDGQFVIWDNRQTDYTGYPTTGGTWTNVELTSDPQFGDLTILTSGGELFAEFMVGWQVQVNAAVPVYLDIVTTTGDGICVSGDVSALVTAEETEFCIIHPVGVNPQNGATQTDPCQPESRYVWGGGYYIPPIVGFEMDHEGNYGIHGNQPGQNKSGQHYMWNRRFDINMGRWTSSDPTMSPAWNLTDYNGSNSTRGTDPSGLSGCSLTIWTSSTIDENDKSDRTGLGTHCTADTKAEFVECFRKKMNEPGCDCIDSVVIGGHGGSGLGDKAGTDDKSWARDLSSADKTYLRSIMCTDASVEIRKCNSYNSVYEMDIIVILLGGTKDSRSERGCGWDGDCTAAGLPHWRALLEGKLPKKRNYWVPKGAGTSSEELDAVWMYNEAVDECVDTYQSELAKLPTKGGWPFIMPDSARWVAKEKKVPRCFMWIWVWRGRVAG